MINVRQTANKHGDIGLIEYDCHASLDKRVFREWNGAMEWAYEKEFTCYGWQHARTYASMFSIGDFTITE
jgi:hypothetical protein